MSAEPLPSPAASQPASAERLPSRALPFRALLVLALGVVVGAVCFGAPPRFGVAENAGEPWRGFLESLGPLALVHAAIAIGLGLVVTAGCRRRDRPGLPGGPAVRRAALPLVVLLVFGLFQMVPLPTSVLGLLAPFSAATYGALELSGEAVWRPLSLFPDGTQDALYTLGGMLAASVATWTLVRDVRRRAGADSAAGDAGARDAKARDAGARVAARVLVFVVVLAAAESAYGLYEVLLGDDRILGLGKVSNPGSVTGTFIHRTLLAVWAGMGLCAALGLAAHELVGRGAGAGAGSGGRATRWGRVLLLVAVAILCAVAALMTTSRTGFAAVLAGAFVTLLLLGRVLVVGGRRRTGRLLYAVTLVTPVLAIGAALALPAFRERIEYVSGYLAGTPGPVEPRIAIWQGAWDLFQEAPIVGTGLGAFARAAHLTQSIDSSAEAWFVHCDPLDLLCGGGLIGLVLGAWWVVGLLARGRFGLGPRSAAARTLAVGAVGGAVVVLIASLADFQTQFPVVAIVFAALLTLPAALSEKDVAPDRPTERAWLLPPRALAACCVVAFAVLSFIPLAEFAGRWSARAAGDPIGATDAERRVARARATLAGVSKSADPQAALAAAEDDLRVAAIEDPLLDEAHFFLALTYLHLKRDREDVLRALGRARRVSRGHASVNLRVGLLYTSLGEYVDTEFGLPGDGALAAFREAGALEPQVFTAAWGLAGAHGFGPEERELMTPDRAHAQITLGKYFVERQLPQRAVTAFRRALDVEPWSAAAHLELADAVRADDPDEARRLYREALRLAPGTEGVVRRAQAGLQAVGDEP